MNASVLRRPDGLVELALERSTPFQVPAIGAGLDGVGEYVEVVRPLRLGPESPVVAAATLLATELEPGPEMFAAITTVLGFTVADHGAFDRSFAVPPIEEAPEPPRRTAAHPRGFRGTKQQPPKPARPGGLCVLPHLDGGHRQAALLARLGLVVAPRPIDALPPVMQRLLATSLYAANDADHVAELIAACWALELPRDPLLRRTAARLVARWFPFGSIAWLRVLERIDPRRRHALAELMVETEVGFRPPPVEAIVAADALCDDATYRHRMHYLLRRIDAGDAAAYALDGFALANRYRPDVEFDAQGDAEGVLPAVEAAMAVIGRSRDRYAATGFAVHLWRQCGELEGLAPLIAGLPWRALDADTAFRLADLLGNVAYYDSADVLWSAVRAHAGEMVGVLAAIEPRYRAKAVRYLGDLCGDDWVQAGPLDRAVVRLLALLPRLCAPPFATEDRGGEALARMLVLDDAAWTAVAAAPDASFDRLERACRRHNDERLIELGLWSLARRLGALTGRAFVAGPGPLLASAATLGAVLTAAREALLSRELATPLFTATPTSLDAAALVALVDGARSPAAAALVSRALRAHLRGETPLRDGQVERARQQIVAGWDAILLGRLVAAVEEQLASPFGGTRPRDERERHALLFITYAFEHRRALRRLLAAHFRGDRRYLADHPANQAWLRAHPAIDATLWTHGLEHHVATAAGGVTLALERDPLEVLRLGTYVGSCLSLGGGHSYSAVAIMLDVNKQVVYARDRGGAVLARQVLALSEGDRLYCFEIYPASAPDDLKAAFHAYDRGFAAALGVAVHDPAAGGIDDEDDPIALVLSRHWWFDDPLQVAP